MSGHSKWHNIQAKKGKADAKRGKIFTKIKEIAKTQGIDKTGYRVITNCGKDAGQEVMHLHFHLLAGKKLGEKIVG